MPPTNTEPRKTARRTSARVLGAFAAALILAAGLGTLVIEPAAAAPTFDGGDKWSLVPNSGVGGTPVRIYGRNLDSVTQVRFGPSDGPVADKLTHVDNDLVTVMAPAPFPAWIGSDPIDVTLLSDAASVVLNGGFTYTNATVTAVPDTGLRSGDPLTVSVAGYFPGANTELFLASPLMGYAEPRPGVDVFPSSRVLALGVQQTDGSGNVTTTFPRLPAFPNSSDPAAPTCPPSQDQANIGMGRCAVGNTRVGASTLTTPVAYTGEPVAAPPTMGISLDLPTSAGDAQVGTTASLDGLNWSGSPAFGSSTSYADRAGATPLSIEICGIDGAGDSCEGAGVSALPVGASTTTAFPTRASGAVTLTRFRGGKLSGATLRGLLTVGSSFRADGCATCFLRVSQQLSGGSGGTLLEVTAPLPIAAGPGVTPVVPTTTTTSPTTSTTRPSTTSTTLCTPWTPVTRPSTSTSSTSSTSTSSTTEQSTTSTVASSTTTTRPCPTRDAVTCKRVADEWTVDFPSRVTTGTLLNFTGKGLYKVKDISFLDQAMTKRLGDDIRRVTPEVMTARVPAGLSGLITLVLEGGCPPQFYEDILYITPPDFILDVQPRTGLKPGDTLTVRVERYVANKPVGFVMLSPTINYIEPQSSGPPHQLVQIKIDGGTTDNNGNLTGTFTLPSTPRGISRDPKATCPVSQEVANHGLTHCIFSITAFTDAGIGGIIEGEPLVFDGDPGPQDPTLDVVQPTAKPGQKVELNGANWWGQPRTGSEPDLAGTAATSELCGIGGDPGNCQDLGPVTIPRVVYHYNPRTDTAKGGTFTGATIEPGTKLTVPNLSVGCACTVRVRQPVAGTDTFIEAEDTLTVDVRAANTTTTGPQSTTTTRRGATTTTRPSGRPLGGNNGIGPNTPGAGVPPAQPVQVVGPGSGGGGAPANVLAPVVVPGIAPSPSPVQQRAPKGAVQQSNLMVRHVDERSAALSAALYAGGVAMAAVGCLFVAGGRAVLGSRRHYTYNTSKQGRPRPRGAY